MSTWYKLSINTEGFYPVNYYFKTAIGAGKQPITGMCDNPSLGNNILIVGDNWYDKIGGTILLNFKSNILQMRYKNAFHSQSSGGDEFKISGSIFSGYRIDSRTTGIEMNTSSIIIFATTDLPYCKE